MNLVAFLFALLLPASAMAAEAVSVHPATSTPAQLIKQNGIPDPNVSIRPSWEATPEESSQRYLKIVQGKLGDCDTAEAEQRAKSEIEAEEIVRMQQIINDQQHEINKLRMHRR